MKRIFLTLSVVLTVMQLVAQDYRYWVNDGGNLNDKNHWSITSGGKSGEALSATTDVVFDQNSFSQNSIVRVNNDIALASVKSNGASFRLIGKKSISISGDIDIDANVDMLSLMGEIHLNGVGSHTINIASRLGADIYVESGEWTLQSALNTTGNITVVGGKLNTAGYEVACSEFSAKDAAQLALAESEITIDKWAVEVDNASQVLAQNATLYFNGAMLKNYSSTAGIKYGAMKNVSLKGAKAANLELIVTNVSCNTSLASNLNASLQSNGKVKVVINHGVGVYDIFTRIQEGMTIYLTKVAESVNNFEIENLSPGSITIGYSLPGGDELGSDEVTIGEPSAISTVIAVTKDADCHGDPIKEIAATATGGASPYSYLWTEMYGAIAPSVSRFITNVPDASELQVLVTDANGCRQTTNYSYYADWEEANDYKTQPKLIVADADMTPACEGANTGSVTITATGGTGTFTSYTVNGTTVTAPNNMVDGLAAGTYTFYATDSHGCKSEDDYVTVDENPAPIPVAGANDDICADETSYTLSGASTQHTTSVVWSTSGTGTFDNASVVKATYHPSSSDIAAGSVTLTLTANGMAGCSPVTDNMTLTINPLPVPTITTVAGNICGYNTTLAATANLGGTLDWELVSGAGSASIVGNAVTVNADGDYTFRVKETTATGCVGYSATTVTLTFNAAPTVDITTADAEICEDGSQTISATATNYSSFVWSATAGTLSNTSSLTNVVYTPTIGATGNQTITLTVNGKGACSSVADQMTIKVNHVPAPTLVTTDADVCGLSSQLKANTDGGGSVVWTAVTAGVTIANPTSATTDVTVNAAGAYTFYMTETIGNCSGSTNEVTLTFFDAPDVTITTMQPGSICHDGKQTLAATVVGNVDLVWTTSGSGSFSSTTTANTIYTPSVADYGTTVTLTLTASGKGACVGQTASDNFTLKVNPRLNPVMSMNTQFCGLSGSVQATGIQDGSAVVWSKRDGPGIVTFSNSTISGGVARVDVSVSEAGSYDFELVESLNGCSSSLPNFTSVTFFNEPTISLPKASDVSCSADPYTLKATPTNCSTVNWTVTGGTGTFTPATGANVKFTPNFSASDLSVTYTITAIGISSAGVCPNPTATMTLTVSRTPDPTIVAPAIACGMACDIEATNVLAGSTRNWTKISGPGNLTFSNASSSTTNVTASAEGLYEIQFEESLGGCSALTTAQVTFYASPEANAGPDLAICAGESVTLTDARVKNSVPSVFDPVAWTTSGSGTFYTSAIRQPVYEPSAADIAAGSVTLTLTATHAHCGTHSDDMVLTINPIPTPSIIPVDGTDICGLTTTLTGVASLGGSLEWSQVSGPAQATSIGDNTVVPVGGTYVFQLTETANNCEGTATITVKFTEKPSIVLNPTSKEICSTETVELTATFDHCTSVNWSVTGGGVLSVATISGKTSKVTYTSENVTVGYTATITATPVGGCDASGVQTATIIVNGMPAPFLSDVTVCGLNTSMSVTPSVAGSVLNWSGAGLTFSSTTSSTPTISVAAGGTYIVTLEEIAGNCNNTATAQITFIEEPVANAGAADAVCASESSYSITDASASNYSSLAWSTSGTGTFTNGTSLAATYNFSAADIAAGSVTLTLTAEANTPCAVPATSTKVITINPLPVPTISGDNSICLNGQADYTTESGMSNYVWSVTGGSILAGQGTATATISWETVGAGSVSVNYTNGNGCEAAVATLYNVTVNPLPNIGLAAAIDACTNSSQVIDANVTVGLAPFTHLWTGDVAYLDATNVEAPTFACDVAGTYTLNYQVTDANGCENTASTTITNIQGPSVFAGADAIICYASDYTIEDATMADATSVLWTTSGDGTFDNPTSLNPTYTPGGADLTSLNVTLTITATSATCGSISDDMNLDIAPAMDVAIGTYSPFLISATTNIEVKIDLQHQNYGQLQFYLVSPDGKEVKLYDHVEDVGNNCYLILRGNKPAKFTFNTSATQTLNLCSLSKTATTLSGTFMPTDINGWENIYGEDPAKGGWAVRIVDIFAGQIGELTQSIISFTDVNHQGNMQTITFNSGNINTPILDNGAIRYISPIGLSTSCYGACDARAVVNVIGGSGVYNNYIWEQPAGKDPVQGTNEVDLCGGDYRVTVTDSRGCSATGIIHVLEPDPILLSTVATDVTCNGSADGSMSVTATQGVGAYTYQWDDADASTTADVNNVAAGDYTVWVTDENHCSVSADVTISEPTAISVDNIAITASDCSNSTGSIELTISGGTPLAGGTYDITCATATFVNGLASNLAADSYSVTIKDANGCSIDTVITVPDNGDITFVSVVETAPVLCNGSNTGSARAQATTQNGNISDLYYEWYKNEVSGSPITTNTEGLISNIYGDVTYYVKAIDQTTGCSATESITLSQPDALSINVIGFENPLCIGSATGSAEVEATGGSAPYTYSWEDANGDAATSTTLTAGDNVVTVSDANGCTFSETITLVDPMPIVTSITFTPTNCQSFDGTATVEVVSGGVAPFTYEWTNANKSTTATADGLGVERYYVTVTDANNCSVVDSVDVTDNSVMTMTVLSTTNVTSACSNDGEIVIQIDDAFGDVTCTWYDEAGNEVDGVLATADGTRLYNIASAGTYTVVVVDEHSCTKSFDIALGGVLNLNVRNTINVSPTCYGGNDGEMTIDESTIGGVGPYTIEWLIDNTFGNYHNNLLANQVYEVKITDGDGCEAVVNVGPIDSPSPIIAEFEYVPAGCAASDGSITVTGATFEGVPVTINDATWFDADGAMIASGLVLNNVPKAKYQAVISTAMGCDVDTLVTLKDMSTLELQLVSIDMPMCKGAENGTVKLAVLGGGSDDYTFDWYDELNNLVYSLNDATNTTVKAGKYTIVVTDNQSHCDALLEITVDEPEELVANIVFTQQVVCAGDKVASFYVKAQGGTPDYTFTWTHNGEVVGTDTAITNAEEGWYYVEVRDANNCVAETSVQIIFPEPINIEIVTTESECDTPTGTATATVTGGVAPYTYVWHTLMDLATVSNDANPINLAVDTYVLEVQDSLGCVVKDTVDVQDNGSVDFEWEPLSNILCPSNCNGEAQVTKVYDDNQLYNTFNVIWNDTEVGEHATQLCLGTNKVVVIAPNNCRAVEYITMTDEDALRVKHITNYPDLDGDPNCNGMLIAQIDGGIGNYTAVWTNEVGDTLSNSIFDAATNEAKAYSLCEGSYTLTIKDENPDGCEIIENYIIEHRPLLFQMVSQTDATCYGYNNGNAKVEGVGGLYEPYKYEWYAVGSTDLLSDKPELENVFAGEYYFIISQHDYMTKISDTITIGQPSTRLHIPSDMVVTKGTKCYETTGSVRIYEQGDYASAFSGFGPFTYIFSNPNWAVDSIKVSGEKVSITNLPIDNYSLTVIDALGCEFDTVYHVEDLSHFKVELAVDKPRCYGKEGTVIATASSDNGIRSYTWNNGTAETTGRINGKAGTYYVMVEDEMNCQRFDTIEIPETPKVAFTLGAIEPNTCFNGTDGSVRFDNITGGLMGVYDQFIFIGANETINKNVETRDSMEIITGVPTGEYKVYIMDVNDCESDTINVTVPSRHSQMATTITVDDASCEKYFANGNLSIDGEFEVGVSVVNQYSVSGTVEEPVFFQLGSNRPSANNKFSKLAAGNYKVVVGFSSDMVCPDTLKVTVGADNKFALAGAYIYRSSTSNEYADEVYVCPEEEDLQANFHTTDNFSIDKRVWYLNDSIVDDSVSTWASLTPRGAEGNDYYYRVQAYNDKCMDMDTLHVIVLNPTDTLKAGIVMADEGVEPQDNVYQLFGGIDLMLHANQGEALAFDVPQTVEYQNAYYWATSKDVAWQTTADTISPIIVAKEDMTIKVVDTVSVTYAAISDTLQCVFTDSMVVSVLSDIRPPEVFTPNGDGANDTWVINGIHAYQKVEVVIFNRWGGRVWQKSGVYEPWDGTNAKGKNLPSGTYYYSIKCSDSRIGTKEKSGPVTIIR